MWFWHILRRFSKFASDPLNPRCWRFVLVIDLETDWKSKNVSGLAFFYLPQLVNQTVYPLFLRDLFRSVVLFLTLSRSVVLPKNVSRSVVPLSYTLANFQYTRRSKTQIWVNLGKPTLHKFEKNVYHANCNHPHKFPVHASVKNPKLA